MQAKGDLQEARLKWKQQFKKIAATAITLKGKTSESRVAVTTPIQYSAGHYSQCSRQKKTKQMKGMHIRKEDINCLYL